MANNERPSEPKAFRQEEFAKDPSQVMRCADRDGAAIVVDAEGKPRMRIGASLERHLVID